MSVTKKMFERALKNPNSLTTAGLSPVWSAFCDVMRLEAEADVTLTNAAVAALIREAVPTAKTTHKSVASYRSKRRDDIARIKREHLA